MELRDLVQVLDDELNAKIISDYCPNGLQVEGKHKVERIVSGVTASQALIDRAIEQNADAILVHHGYFWKGEPSQIVGMKRKRIQSLLTNDISLIAYHLPIDVHPVLGNNKQLGDLLGLNDIRAYPNIKPHGIVMQGEFENPISHSELSAILQTSLHKAPTSIGNKPRIKRIAWCTGGGQNYIDSVVEPLITNQHESIDAFISGEISEQTTHSAYEQNIDYFAVGHHASERYGVKALGEWLASHHGLQVNFIDIDNPA